MTPADRSLPDADARDRVTAAPALDGTVGFGETLFVEAAAGSGKTRSLVERVVALVATGTTPLERLAAITFTEKAAAELRDRIRGRLEEVARDRSRDQAQRTRCEEALEQVDMAAISTLHAFAQRLLGHHPIEAGLPPHLEVLDEVAAQIDFEQRWQAHRRRMLDDPSLARTLRLARTLGIDLDALRQLADAFTKNWDLASDPTRVPWTVTEPPEVSVAELLARFEELSGRAEECTEPADRLLAYIHEEVAPYIARLRQAPDEDEQLRLLGETPPTLKAGRLGSKNNWPDIAGVRDAVAELRGARERIRDQVLHGVAHPLAASTRDFAVDAAEGRRADGRVNFHDLLVLSRELLRGPAGPEVRQALRQRYERLLLDEFQDTDPIQIELAVLLAATDDDASQRQWPDTPTEEGRLFFVGDPKQSIYRFRRADIALYLQAREVFADRQPVELVTNFRSAPTLISWINHVFERLIQPAEGSQPNYQPLRAAPNSVDPDAGPVVGIVGQKPARDDANAADLRAAEAAAVADAARAAVAEGWQVRETDADGEMSQRPATLGDIAILLPTRTSLPALEEALDERGIAYRAESSSLVYSTSEVRDVMAVLRAIADPTDQLSLAAALRSPVFGCGDDDLVEYGVVHGGRLDLTCDPPEGVPADHAVAEALTFLRRLHRAATWSSPSELLDRLYRERQLFEAGHATSRPRDVWRRLRFVADQARAWSEAEGRGLRAYLDWVKLQASEASRAGEAILPETDDDAVRIMTVHAAKGLEFPIVMLSGASAQPHSRRGVGVVWPPSGPVGIDFGSAAKTEEYRDFLPVDEQMRHHERVRLLYVACTRAKDHLVVSLHRNREAPRAEKATNAELLADAAADAPAHTVLSEPAAVEETAAAAATPPALLLSHDDWREQRDDALRPSRRPRMIAATNAARLLHRTPDAADQDDPLSLGSATAQKRGYGPAIGRAVHAVLQTVDLDTGDGLDDSVRAQAAAEGVTGRERDVAFLVRSALAAPAVKASRDRPRWRETYVATRVADTTVEGYVDLLYRSEPGLTVVDYKAASDSDDLDALVAHYRAQGAAYALAVEQATGERVHRVTFVFLTPTGPHERDLPDLLEAIEGLAAALS